MWPKNVFNQIPIQKITLFDLFCSFCGGSKNYYTAIMCPGYTGSPVKCIENGQNVLIGLQSFNWACGTQNTPAVYTSLRQLRDWIDYILE